MKRLLIGFIAITSALWVARADSAQNANLQTSFLNKDLFTLYHDVASDVSASNIVGRIIDVYLNLRLCSDRHLLFNDTQVVLDGTTTYQLIKWQFNEAEIEKVKGQKNVTCHVKGRILEVRRGPTTSGMPYVIAQLEQLALAHSEPMPLTDQKPNQ